MALPLDPGLVTFALKVKGDLEAFEYAQAIGILPKPKFLVLPPQSGREYPKKRTGTNRVDLSRSDLIRLLSYLEGELQARDVVIATLKSEKAKQLLYQAKYGRLGANDPFAALQRDSDQSNENFDEKSTARMYESQLSQLEKLISVQKRAHVRAKQVLTAAERRHLKTVRELEGEKQQSVQDAAQGDDVCMMLEKERDKLKIKIDQQSTDYEKLKQDMDKMRDTFEAEKERHKAIVLYLLNERKQLQSKLIEERNKISALKTALPEQSDDELSKLKCLCADQHEKMLNLDGNNGKLVRDKQLLKSQLEAQLQETASLREIVRTQEEDLNLIRRNILAKTQQYAQRHLQAQQPIIDSFEDLDLPSTSVNQPVDRPPQPPSYQQRQASSTVPSKHHISPLSPSRSASSLLQKRNSNPEQSFVPSSPVLSSTRPSNVRILTNASYMHKHDGSTGPARFPQVSASDTAGESGYAPQSSSLPNPVTRLDPSRPKTLPAGVRRSAVPPPPPPAYASPVSSNPSSNTGSSSLIVHGQRARPVKQNSTGSTSNERRTQVSSGSGSSDQMSSDSDQISTPQLGPPSLAHRSHNGSFGVNGDGGRLPRLTRRTPTPAPGPPPARHRNSSANGTNDGTGNGTIRRRFANFASALPNATKQTKLKKATQV